MSKPEQTPEEQQVVRTFDEAYADFASFYSDFAQVLATEHEIRLQFYETIPGPPKEGGRVETATSRLRASVTVSMPHAKSIATVLQNAAEEGKGGEA